MAVEARGFHPGRVFSDRDGVKAVKETVKLAALAVWGCSLITCLFFAGAYSYAFFTQRNLRSPFNPAIRVHAPTTLYLLGSIAWLLGAVVLVVGLRVGSRLVAGRRRRT